MLNIQDLEQAFAEIDAIGKGSIECNVDGKIVVLTSLLPAEELAVQKYAALSFEENKDALSSNMDFLDRFQIGLLSYAVTRIGNLDLTGVTAIETGETLANGVKVKVPRHEAVRKLVNSWSRPVRQFLFRKYNDLLEQIDAQTEKVIVYDPVDLDTEIERLQARLEDFRKRKADREADQQAKHPFRQQVQTFATQDLAEAPAPVQSQPAPVQPQPAPAPREPVPNQATRTPIIPATVPPPVPVQHAPKAEARVVLDAIEASQQQQWDEYLDLEDEQAQMEAENLRLFRAQQARHQQQLQAQQLRRPPPHAGVRVDPFDTHTPVAKVGEMDGVDAYAIGTPQMLNDKIQPGRSFQDAVVNPRTDGGAANPRFRRP